MAKKAVSEKNELVEKILGKEPKPKKYSNVSVERTTSAKISLPERMSLKDARVWLERQEQQEEQMISFRTELKAYPFDGAYALYRAIKENFGHAEVMTEKGPSGDNPPEIISIRLPNGEYVRCPWGKVQFPGLDDGSYLEMKYNSQQMKFIIVGQIKKKYEKVIEAITEMTKDILLNDSIYKGQAIKVDLSFLNSDGPAKNPDFLDVMHLQERDILMNDITKLNFSSILLRIEKTEECLDAKIPLKHGCLLAGQYGTGKTLLALYTAKKCVENGWTFIYIEDCHQTAEALRLAEMYAPAVVFSED
jgi:hypothetical protein